MVIIIIRQKGKAYVGQSRNAIIEHTHLGNHLFFHTQDSLDEGDERQGDMVVGLVRVGLLLEQYFRGGQIVAKE
jgi:hypothetical protein